MIFLKFEVPISVSSCLWLSENVQIVVCTSREFFCICHYFFQCCHRPLSTHLPLVPYICVSESYQHWFRKWLVHYLAPNLDQCWHIVNWTIRSKLQWNFNQNTKLFIHENAPEIMVCEMAAIFVRAWVGVGWGYGGVGWGYGGVVVGVGVGGLS